jgi:tetratricopeptide (TPR) repeat protein
LRESLEEYHRRSGTSHPELRTGSAKAQADCRQFEVSPSTVYAPLARRGQSVTGIGYAFVELRRFDEAAVAAKKALRQNPSYGPAYRCLASAFAHLGRDAEARDAAARLLEVDPAFTISWFIARGGQSNAKLTIEGLRKAGLPE